MFELPLWVVLEFKFWAILPFRRGRKAFEDICKGLFSLHSNRIAHLDMKTCNCLFAQDGTCKISDLGLGKLMAADRTNVTAESMGTWAYIAPETMIDGRCGLSSDIFALSTIIFEVPSFPGGPYYPYIQNDKNYRRIPEPVVTVISRLQAKSVWDFCVTI